MADYENLLDSIDAVIRSNNRREITGQILQNTLHQMVASLGENYQLAGFATPTLDPSEPDQNVFYLTDEAGVYTNFDNITLGNGLSFLMWKNGTWSSKTMNIVTAQWVDDNYVSKAFLRQMFRAYDEDGVEIFANDTTSIIDNIKAMCGLWTNQYLSALGLGADGGGGASTLAKLNDVQLINLQDGQALVYDLASNHWVNRTIQSGVDMIVVWAALAAATNEQINASHLTTALSGYVTTTALATTLANYVTTTALASALADYAAKSWVETNYVSKSFFNSLFQAEDSNGNAITPNNSGQTAIDRLKILVGAYTDQYLSALGLSEEAGASSYLYGLGDVQLDTQTLASGQALIYSSALGKWTNGEAGVNMAQVWTALATADATKQIDISHISSALSGYVTTSSLSTTLANYVTTSALSTTLTDYVTNTSLTTTLAAYGTKTWVESNYISKAFFNRLFRAFAPVAEGESEAAQVEPNDVTTEIDNIKAMFGLWTEQYLSALGLGSDAGHSIGVLDDLNDVTISNPQTNQVLKYVNGEWVNAAAPSGATALSGLTDVAISSIADKDLLQWDYASGKWKNVVLSTVMSGYATTSQLANYLPLRGGIISGGINPNADSKIDLGTSTAKYHYIYAHRLVRLQSIAKGDTYDSYKLNLPDKSGTIAVTSDLNAYNPTNNFKTVNGQSIIGTGDINVGGGGGSYLPLSGGTLTGTLTVDTSIYFAKGAINSTIKSQWGHYSDYVFFSNVAGQYEFRLKDNGELLYGHYQSGTMYNIWHSGNFTPSNYLPLGGGTMTGIIYGNTGSGLIVQSNNTGSWCEGIRVYPASNNYCLISLQDSASNNVLAMVHNVVKHSAYIEYRVSDTGYVINYPAKSGTFALTSDFSGYATESYVSGNYLPLSGGTVTGQTIFSKTGASRNSAVVIGGTSTNVNTSVCNQTSMLQLVCGSGGNATFGIGFHNPGISSSVLEYGNTKNLVNATVSYLALKTDCPDVHLRIGNVTSSDNWYVPYSFTIANPNSYSGWIASFGTSTTGVLLGVRNNQPIIGNTTSTSYGLNLQPDGGNVGINTNSPSYKLHVTGDIYATGGVTALSDIRKKDVTAYELPLNIEQIANAPTIKFLWKDKHEEGEQVGTIAQYWQNVLPWVIKDKSGELSMQYGVAALVSAIVTARKVVNHEERIKALEKENADLKQAYSFIKNAYDYLKMDYEQLKLKIA